MFYQHSAATEGTSQLSNLEGALDQGIPPRATHFADFYGERKFYQAVRYQHMNEVSETMQTRVRVNVWEAGKWIDVGSGFSARLLRRIETTNAPENRDCKKG